MTWKSFPHYLPIVWGTESHHKMHRNTEMLCSEQTGTKCRFAGDLRRHDPHVTWLEYRNLLTSKREIQVKYKMGTLWWKIHNAGLTKQNHDDVIKWKHLPRYWPFVGGNLPATRGFPWQRPVTRNFDASFDLRLSKRLSKQSKRRWFETPLRSLWRYCNVVRKRKLILKSFNLCIWCFSRILQWLSGKT